MTVAVDDDSESSGFGFQIELAEIVQSVNSHATRFHDFSLRQRLRPRAGIDIAANRSYGCDSRESFKNVWISDIAGVEDAVSPSQRFEGFGPQQAMGVGDYAESHCFLGHGPGSPGLSRSQHEPRGDGRIRPSDSVAEEKTAQEKRGSR